MLGFDQVIEFDGETGLMIGVFAGARAEDGDTLILAKGFAFGHDGHLLVAERFLGYPGETGRILKYDGVTGALLGTFVPNGPGGIMNQTGKIAFGPNGNLFAWSGYGLAEFDGLTGEFIQQVIEPFTCGFVGTVEFVFRPDGNVLVMVQIVGGDRQIWLFSAETGDCLGPQPFIANPSPAYWEAMTLGPNGHLYVPWTDNEPPWTPIAEYDPTTGELLGIPIAAGIGELNGPDFARFGPNGNLFAAHSWGEVREFDVSTLPGTYVGVFCSPGEYEGADGILFRPMHSDGDHDWDRDVHDAAKFQVCFSAPGTGPSDYNCFAFDSDFDGDVDLADAGRFGQDLTGPQ